MACRLEIGGIGQLSAKSAELGLPPLDRQTAFARILAQTKGTVKMAEQATALAEALSHSLLVPSRMIG